LCSVQKIKLSPPNRRTFSHKSISSLFAELDEDEVYKKKVIELENSKKTLSQKFALKPNGNVPKSLSSILDNLTRTKTTEGNENNLSPLVSFFSAVDRRAKELEHEFKFGFQLEKSPRPNMTSKKSEKSNTKVTNTQEKGVATSRRSIFDVLPPPQSTKKEPSTSPNAYKPHESFLEYESSMSEVLTNARLLRGQSDEDVAFVTAWLLNEERQVPIHLPSLEEAMQNQSGLKTMSHGEKRKEFAKEVDAQRQSFLEKTGMTANQHKFAQQALSALGNKCARVATGGPMRVAWEKLKESGMMPRENIMSTYLYVVGNHFHSSSMSGGFGMLGATTSSIFGQTLGEQTILDTIRSPQTDESLDETLPDLPMEVATFHDLLYRPTEKSISLRVKSLVQHGSVKEAEQLLQRMERVKNTNEEQTLRLRTYLPVLKAHCDKGNIADAFKVFSRMRQSPGVFLEPENYVLLMASAAENGCFTLDAPPLEAVVYDAGYTSASGPNLFVELVQQMTQDVLTITSASARRLHNAFYHGFKNDPNVNLSPNLKEIPSLGSVPACNEPITTDENELVLSRVIIDDSSGICPRTGARLRLILLKAEERALFFEKLMKLAESQFHDFNIKTTNWDEEENRAVQELQRFAHFLNTREGEPYTAIIDGANVAYFGQNFEQGKFNYHQIMYLVEALESKGENPLVILPYKYAMKTFYSNTGPQSKRQTLSEKELEIIRL